MQSTSTPSPTPELNFGKIEAKWQKAWATAAVFKVSEDKKKPKYYVLEMFPYPSGSGLHMGHALNYTIGDIYARFMRMQGNNVLYPMGYDAFGLPAENAAIKAHEHPSDYTKKSIENFVVQQRALGLSYDWSKIITTCTPEYYKWNQYFFLKFFEKGLVYRKKSAVNWCPLCNTVLANEQVHSGKCWRHEDTDVELKQLEQWFIKTTDYAEELLSMVDTLQWPERIKSMQKNWIGKSHGTEINFEVDSDEIKKSEFVFLHAYKDNSKSVFWPWLQSEIEKRGGKVAFAPDLPNTTEPNIEEQIKFVLKNYSFNERTVLVTHSLGGVLALKLLPKLKGKIKKWVMIAPPSSLKFRDGKKRPALEKCCDWKFDYAAAKEKVKEITVLIDEKDDIIRVDSAKEVAQQLSAKERIVVAQENHFNSNEEPDILGELINQWPVFTTRPDTIFGVTFLVVSAQHPKLFDLVTKEQKPAVEAFLKKLKSVSEKELELMDKEGVFTGAYAINPVNNEKVPIWAGNFVVAEYGSGMVMAVPTHDQRDFEFAKKYKIPMKLVIQPQGKQLAVDTMKEAFTGEGTLVNSGKFNGVNSTEAIEKISDFIAKNKLGKKTTNYKLRDWLVSRQRYWGTPIPIVYCDTCGIVPVPEKELPIELPYKVTFGDGNPLASNKEFVNTKCPKCGAKARRETDTMDTFFDSSWYYLRYPDNVNAKVPFEKAHAKYWLPVDQYIGGAEHACMHLIYARFFTKALRDFGMVSMDEPFTKLFNQGMLHASDGNKMSKSLGNVVNPLDSIKQYSADALRFNLMSLSAPNSDSVWSDRGMEAAHKFLIRLYTVLSEKKVGKSSKLLASKTHRTIQEVTEDIREFKYNIAIIKLRTLFDAIASEEEIGKIELYAFLKMLHPICPHITEELWSVRGNKGFLSVEAWPVADTKKIDTHAEKIEEIIATVRLDVLKIKELAHIEKVSKVKIFVAPEWKWKVIQKVKEVCGSKPDFGVAMKAVMADSELKKYGADVQGVIKTTLARIAELSSLAKFDEVAVLKEAQAVLAKEFGTIEIIKAEDSKEPKAKNAFPAKPALLVE